MRIIIKGTTILNVKRTNRSGSLRRPAFTIRSTSSSCVESKFVIMFDVGEPVGTNKSA